MAQVVRVNPVRWLVGRVARLVPESILARLLPRRYRFDPSAIPPPPVPPSTPVRLYVAPVNWAGQGWAWARAAERHLPDVGSVSMAYAVHGDFSYPSDNLVPVGAFALSRRWQRAQREAVTAGFTHVLLEAERRPFGAIIDETVEGQVQSLQRAGVAVALVCHGSDIRIPTRHAAEEPYSPFAGMDPRRLRRLQRVVDRNQAVLTNLGLPVFISTPDMFADVPSATWLPVIVDPARWANDDLPLQRAVPVVAHAPSKGFIKGSDLIDPIMQRLDAEGVIEYRRVSGVPAEKMVDVYRDADIVLDQFRIGNYGVAACEAMAAGRVVVSHVDERTRSAARGASGVDLPVIEATADTLEAVIRGIIADPDPARTVAARGPSFVSTIHDGRYSAGVLASFLGQRATESIDPAR